MPRSQLKLVALLLISFLVSNKTSASSLCKTRARWQHSKSTDFQNFAKSEKAFLAEAEGWRADPIEPNLYWIKEKDLSRDSAPDDSIGDALEHFPKEKKLNAYKADIENRIKELKSENSKALTDKKQADLNKKRMKTENKTHSRAAKNNPKSYPTLYKTGEESPVLHTARLIELGKFINTKKEKVRHSETDSLPNQLDQLQNQVNSLENALVKNEKSEQALESKKVINKILTNVKASSETINNLYREHATNELSLDILKSAKKRAEKLDFNSNKERLLVSLPKWNKDRKKVTISTITFKNISEIQGEITKYKSLTDINFKRERQKKQRQLARSYQELKVVHSILDNSLNDIGLKGIIQDSHRQMLLDLRKKTGIALRDSEPQARQHLKQARAELRNERLVSLKQWYGIKTRLNRGLLGDIQNSKVKENAGINAVSKTLDSKVVKVLAARYLLTLAVLPVFAKIGLKYAWFANVLSFFKPNEDKLPDLNECAILIRKQKDEAGSNTQLQKCVKGYYNALYRKSIAEKENALTLIDPVNEPKKFKQAQEDYNKAVLEAQEDIGEWTKLLAQKSGITKTRKRSAFLQSIIDKALISVAEDDLKKTEDFFKKTEEAIKSAENLTEADKKDLELAKEHIEAGKKALKKDKEEVEKKKKIIEENDRALEKK